MTLDKTLVALAFGFGLSACTGFGLLSDGSRLSVGDTCVLDSDCGTGLECEDGACKLHGGDAEADNDDDDQPGSGAACTVDTDCAAGEECDDGACKLHDGDDDGDDDDNSGPGGGDDDDDDGGNSGPG